MTRGVSALLCTVSLALLAACASRHGPGAPVTPSAETPIAESGAGRAYDIALWSGGETTLAGVRTTAFMVMSNAGGLDVRNLDGALLQHIGDRFLGDIDIARVPTAESHFTVLGSSYRASRARGVVLFRFDNVAGGEFRRWGAIATDIDRPTGFCMRQRRGVVNAVVTGADGEVRVYSVAEDADGAMDARELHRFQLGSRAGGCAMDTAHERLYVMEERRGLWRYPLDPGSPEPAVLVQAVDGARLTAPVGGVAVLDDRGRYLVVSSRGDSSIAVWNISWEPEWLGRFIVRAGPAGDEVTGTTGLDAYGGDFGAMLSGVVALQDSVNDGGQNFKLIDWREIRVALGHDESASPALIPQDPANIPPSAPSGSD